MTMKWQVQVSGDLSDLKSLKDATAGLEIRIVEEKDVFYLEAVQLEAYENAREVFAASEKLALVISGIAKLGYGARDQITTSHVYETKDDGAKTCSVFLEDSISVRCTLGIVAVGSTNGSSTVITTPVDPAKQWLVSAISDANVEKALRLYGAGSHDWVGLYRLYEVIEGDLGGMTQVARMGYASESVLRRFKHTANSPGAVGDEARHGMQSSQPPQNPLPLHEAKAIIEAIFHAWLRSK
jgi:hypothetical protein